MACSSQAPQQRHLVPQLQPRFHILPCSRSWPSPHPLCKISRTIKDVLAPPKLPFWGGPAAAAGLGFLIGNSNPSQELAGAPPALLCRFLVLASYFEGFFHNERVQQLLLARFHLESLNQLGQLRDILPAIVRSSSSLSSCWWCSNPVPSRKLSALRPAFMVLPLPVCPQSVIEIIKAKDQILP